MIKCHLSRLMGERRLKVVDVARELGVHRNSITLLYNDTANRVELSTVNALCKFFDCEVGELFEFVDDENEQFNKD